MKAKVSRTEGLKGEISPSPSKSYSHRAYYLGLLRMQPTKIINPLTEGDVGKTIEVCKSLGAVLTEEKNKEFLINPPKELFAPPEIMDCGNSGTTIRILTALALIIKGKIAIKGIFFERNRPIDDLLESLSVLGAKFEYIRNNEHKIIGVEIEVTKIKQNIIKIRGDISSQFITGLMIAAAGLSLRPQIKIDKEFKWDSLIIETTTSVKSFPYLLITQEVLREFGINAEFRNLNENLLQITLPIIDNSAHSIMTSNKILSYNVPPDFSSAAFIISAGALFGVGNGITINNLNMNSLQGDKAIIDQLKDMGAKIEQKENKLIIYGRSKIFDDKTSQYIKYLKGITISCKDTPDSLPILAVDGSFCNGVTKLIDIAHVRLKETDRVAVMNRELSKIGIKIKEMHDELDIFGGDNVKITQNIEFRTDQDHRVVMALTILAMGFAEENVEVTIPDAEFVNDSYPEFFEHLIQLGAKIKL